MGTAAGTHWDLFRLFLLGVCRQKETCGRACLIDHGNASIASQGQFPLTSKVRLISLVSRSTCVNGKTFRSG